ncbi:hypothetical protein [Rhodococcus koreensis]
MPQAAPSTRSAAAVTGCDGNAVHWAPCTTVRAADVHVRPDVSEWDAVYHPGDPGGLLL